jgi:hypothetical protein
MLSSSIVTRLKNARVKGKSQSVKICKEYGNMPLRLNVYGLWQLICFIKYTRVIETGIFDEICRHWGCMSALINTAGYGNIAV